MLLGGGNSLFLFLYIPLAVGRARVRPTVQQETLTQTIDQWRTTKFRKMKAKPT